mmetsp:Transcript_3937/g.9430  ORF Transcript_3937/g.9430 Transcript_3937/m.9430 type:complete len:237 (+) Transcript_3937:1111-1821(+)
MVALVLPPRIVPAPVQRCLVPKAEEIVEPDGPRAFHVGRAPSQIPVGRAILLELRLPEPHDRADCLRVCLCEAVVAHSAPLASVLDLNPAHLLVAIHQPEVPHLGRRAAREGRGPGALPECALGRLADAAKANILHVAANTRPPRLVRTVPNIPSVRGAFDVLEPDLPGSLAEVAHGGAAPEEAKRLAEDVGVPLSEALRADRPPRALEHHLQTASAARTRREAHRVGLCRRALVP